MATLGSYLGRQRDLLIDADVRLRAPDPDPCAAHDARVAARRIRSVLRDRDDLAARPPRTSAGNASVSTVALPLLTAAWLRLRADIESVVSTDAPPEPEPSQAGRPDRGGDAAGDAGHEERAGQPTLIHRIRKRAKTVRYVAEAIAGDAAPHHANLVAFVTELELIRRVLGAYQDAATISSTIEDMRREPNLHAEERTTLERWTQQQSTRGRTAFAPRMVQWPALPLKPTLTTMREG